MNNHLPEPRAPMMSAAKSAPDAFVQENTGSAVPRVLRCRTVAERHFRQANYVRDLPPYAIEQRLGPASDLGPAGVTTRWPG